MRGERQEQNNDKGKYGDPSLRSGWQLREMKPLKKLVKGSKEAETLQVYDYVDFICVV
jgi:hypothetical protein